MEQTLDYLPVPRRDWLTVPLLAIAWLLVPCDTVAAIIFSGWHNGLHSIPRYADLQVRDVLATAIICATPLAGIVCGIGLLARWGKGHWVHVILAAGAVLFHLWNLYVWGRMEIWIWTT